jgi:hypothetical protein
MTIMLANAGPDFSSHVIGAEGVAAQFWMALNALRNRKIGA